MMPAAISKACPCQGPGFLCALVLEARTRVSNGQGRPSVTAICIRGKSLVTTDFSLVFHSWRSHTVGYPSVGTSVSIACSCALAHFAVERANQRLHQKWCSALWRERMCMKTKTL